MDPQLFDTEKKLKWIPYVYLLVILFAIFPILTALLGGAIGESMGCNINEAGTDKCVRIGIPFGEMLSTMVAGGWLFLFTIPLGAIFMVILTFVAINDANYFKKQRK